METQLPQDRLDSAHSRDEVVAAVRDFMSELTPKGMDRLPRYGRPVNVVDAEAVDRWAQQLCQFESAPSQDPVNRALLERVRGYFTRASLRLADFPAAP